MQNVTAMNNDTYLTLITCYHFSRMNTDDYDRLLRSLRASIREVGSTGRVVLVANGTKDGAESPLSVIGDLPLESQKNVFPVTLQSNARNVGGLNAGIDYALKFPPDRRDEWIGQVQSSVVLQPEWRAKLFSDTPKQDAFFGRLVYEDDPSVIWADGHILKCVLTMNDHFGKSISSTPATTTGAFPCLSAAVFRKEAVEAVVKKYGNMVSEILPHYGDCTDIALRLVAGSHGVFEFRPDAIAWKRRPKRDLTQEAIWQLVAARLYYKDRQQCAEQRLIKDAKHRTGFVDALRQAKAIVSRLYAVTNADPPRGGAIDSKWK